ncbi:MAG: RNA 2',3'-cyclic phosphodiesterase [Candidatus Rokubacteria bacterium]|nr:RNA 2',3'-cyclic phosphodiesterase [Candidatus Rokubacteria bacterium]
MLDDAVRGALGRRIDTLGRVAGGVGWIAAENLHLTLKFLGRVDEARLGEIRAALDRAVAGAAPFELRIEGLGAFPTTTRPRVIWAGVADGGRALGELAARVDAELAGVGFEREARAYSAHVTLGRAREPRRHPGLTAAIEKGAGERFGTVRVDRVSLMRSDLSPRGARYTELSSHHLMGGPDMAPHTPPRSEPSRETRDGPR